MFNNRFSRKKAPMCIVCQFAWYKHSSHSRIQDTSMTMNMELGDVYKWLFPAAASDSSSTPWGTFKVWQWTLRLWIREVMMQEKIEHLTVIHSMKIKDRRGDTFIIKIKANFAACQGVKNWLGVWQNSLVRKIWAVLVYLIFIC